MTTTTQTPDTKGFQTGNALLITFSHLLLDTYMVFVAPLLPLLITKFGLSYFLAALLAAAIRIPSLLNPLIGIVADKIRLRYFIIITPAIAGIVMSLLGVAHSYPILLLLILAGGVSSACYHVTAPVMTRYLAGEKVGRGMSFFMLGGDLAATIGPIVILGAVDLLGLDHTYWLMFAGVFSSLFLHIRFKKIAVQRPVRSHQTTPPSLKQTSKALFPLFLKLTGTYVAIASLEATLTSFLPTYLTAKGVSLWAAGLSLSLLQVGGIAGSMTAGSLSDRLGRKNVLVSIVSALPVLMWLFIFSHGILGVLLLVILGTFLFGLRPVMLAIVHDTNSDYPAYVNGVYMMINFVTNSVMLLAMGLLSDKIGLDNMYRVAATISVGAVFFALRIPEK